MYAFLIPGKNYFKSDAGIYNDRLCCFMARASFRFLCSSVNIAHGGT